MGTDTYIWVLLAVVFSLFSYHDCISHTWSESRALKLILVLLIVYASSVQKSGL